MDDDDNDKNILIGKKLVGVFVSEDKEAIKFKTNKGDVIAIADGDCCSHSWIESVESPSHSIGGTVLSVEDIDMPEETYDESEHECLRFYGCKITTDNGSFVIDYRNSSNGYYGGSLSWPGDYFYCGGSGQNGQVDDSTKWIEVK